MAVGETKAPSETKAQGDTEVPGKTTEGKGVSLIFPRREVESVLAGIEGGEAIAKATEAPGEATAANDAAAAKNARGAGGAKAPGEVTRGDGGC